MKKRQVLIYIIASISMIACIALCIILLVNNNDTNHNLLWALLIFFLGPITIIILTSVALHTKDSIKETKELEKLIRDDLDRHNRENK